MLLPAFTTLEHTISHVWLLNTETPGNWQPFNFTASDVFWGQLGGLMEAIDGGTTCVVDHAHMAYTPNHGKHAVLLSDTH